MFFGIGLDSSPSPNGYEFFGGVLEIYRNGVCIYSWPLPIVSLGYGFTSLMDKVFAFLHMVYLLAGPRRETMQDFLKRVRLFISDWGTEAAMYRVPDFFPLFVAWANNQDCAEMQADPNSRLMDECCFIPGWMHIWANLVKDYCYRFFWFPSWLKCLKGVVKLLGKRMYKEAVKLWLVQQKQYEHVPAVSSFSASFAKWRWQTLDKCCKNVAKVEGLRILWPKLCEDIFPSFSEDPEALEAGGEGMENDIFWLRLKQTIRPGTSYCEVSRTWGAGCLCHEEERRAGQTVGASYY